MHVRRRDFIFILVFPRVCSYFAGANISDSLFGSCRGKRHYHGPLSDVDVPQEVENRKVEDERFEEKKVV